MASRSEYFAARLRSPTAQVIALALTFVLAGTAAFVGGLARDSLSSSGAAVGSLLGAVTASTGRQLFGLRATSPSGRSLAMQVIFDVVGAVAGSAILFYVAVVAFELQNSNAFNPAGTVLFGGVAGWLSATAIAGRLRAAEEFGAPFRTVASIINDLIDEKTTQGKYEVHPGRGPGSGGGQGVSKATMCCVDCGVGITDLHSRA